MNDVAAVPKDVGPGNGITTVTWNNVTQDSNLLAYPTIYMTDKTIHVYGEYGAATVEFHGSNNADNTKAPKGEDVEFELLYGDDDNALVFNASSARKLNNIRENSFWGMPVIKDADQDTNLTIVVTGRKTY